MSTTHVITGATGLIGAALVLTIAEHSDDEMICLVRPGSQAPETRLHQVLERAAAAYDTPRDVLDSTLRRTRAVPADLGEDLHRSRLSFPARTGRVEYWHGAARMLFRERDRRVSFATNVAGTRRVLDLARRTGADAFTYISTAYVAGRAEGVVREEPIAVPQARTPYERSKISAERLVAAAGDFPVRILRPSVVVGHSSTLRYPGTSSGAYTIQQLIAAYHRGRIDRGEPFPPRRMLVRADQPFNLVPVDHVVRQAHALSTRATAALGIFHLTNPTPPTTGDVVRAQVANTGALAPHFVTDPDELTWEDRQLAAAIGVYQPFLNNPQHFDRGRTDAALPTRPGSFDWSPDTDTLRALFRPFAGRPRRAPGRRTSTDEAA
ncbi:SDR family oxidoreductase [Streptomyces sp. S.PB5]|uniref:SDR family oxidoreductase n=1 Tax=Streptomyces sp. S.PB5 TaxID=3020844 RepID=UPI0025B071E2|nr:SDR family oxidoreductase [Streptomyces sp. S.PB5]MDN3020983.1 SDR family oxidoreductase [Streptomyces sp. S.PB5]